MRQLSTFAPASSLERIEIRLAQRTRAKRLVIAMGVGMLALVAFLPAAGQAQTSVERDVSTTPATPGPATPMPSAGPSAAPTAGPSAGSTGSAMPAAPAAPATAMPPATAPAPIAAPAPITAAPAQPSPPVAVPPPPPPSNAMVKRISGPITYICGGVAQDEQRELAAQSRNFNMRLLFTEGPRGEYLSDVNVKLMRGGREVASFVADGPKCLVQAPEGSYSVRATYEGRTRTQIVSTGTHEAQMRW